MGERTGVWLARSGAGRASFRSLVSTVRWPILFRGVEGAVSGLATGLFMMLMAGDVCLWALTLAWTRASGVNKAFIMKTVVVAGDVMG